MKKLNLPNQPALTPFWTDDLKYLQEGVAEALCATLKGLGLDNDDFVISGCKITTNGSKISMTAGWMYFNGEILPVRALPATSYSGTPKIKFTKQTNYNPAGDRQVSTSGQTGTSQIYEDDYLEPSLVSGSETYRLAIGKGAWNLAERILNHAKAVDSGVVNADDSSEVRYRMVGGVVQLYGSVFNDALGGFHGVVATGLPKPAVDVTLYFDPSYASEYIHIGTNGKLSIFTKSNRVYLNHVMYLATPVYNTDDGHYSNTQQQQQQGGVES